MPNKSILELLCQKGVVIRAGMWSSSVGTSVCLVALLHKTAQSRPWPFFQIKLSVVGRCLLTASVRCGSDVPRHVCCLLGSRHVHPSHFKCDHPVKRIRSSLTHQQLGGNYFYAIHSSARSSSQSTEIVFLDLKASSFISPHCGLFLSRLTNWVAFFFFFMSLCLPVNLFSLLLLLALLLPADCSFPGTSPLW